MNSNNPNDGAEQSSAVDYIALIGKLLFNMFCLAIIGVVLGIFILIVFFGIVMGFFYCISLIPDDHRQYVPDGTLFMLMLQSSIR